VTSSAIRRRLGLLAAAAALGGAHADAAAAPAPPIAAPSATGSSAAASGAADSPAVAPLDDASGVNAVEVSGWVLLGLGGASFIAGVVTGILAVQQSKQLDLSCPDARCPPEWHAGVDAFHVYRATSTATLAAAGALSIAGVALLLAAPAEEPASGRVTASVRVVAHPMGLGLEGVF
jgi:hypothetical protein